MSGAASTGFGLGSGTLAPPPPLTSRWQDGWVPRKIEVKEWVQDWARKHIQGLQETQAKSILEEFEEAVTPEVKARVDWTHSKERALAEENYGESVVLARDRAVYDDRSLEEQKKRTDRNVVAR